MLKAGVQCLIDNKEILFEKASIPTVSYNDVSIVTIFDNSSRVSTKRPVRITSVPKVAPLIIIMLGPIPYSSNKTVHGIMEVMSTTTVSSKIVQLLKIQVLRNMTLISVILQGLARSLEAEGFYLQR